MEKLKTLKKLTILSIILFSILLITFDKVLAYGEEVSPMYTYSSDITILSPWTEEQEQIAMDYVNNNCQSYNNYLLSSVGIGSSYGDIAIYVYCFNGNYSYLATSMTQYKTNTEYYSNYYLYPNSDAKLSGIRSMLKTDNTWYRTSETFSTSSKIKKGINEMPMFKSNLDGVYLDNTYSPSSYYNFYNSVKYNDLIYNIGDKFYDLENSSFYSPTSFEYEISEGTDKGKKLSLFFNGYKETDYTIINNYQTGEEITILDLKNNSTKIFDNISQDNTFIVVIYNENDEIILTKNIDIQEQLRLSGERYILVGGLNIQELNSYFLAFYNTEKEDRCFYKFKDEEEQEIDCSDETIVIKSPNKNTYVENYIKDKNDKIVVIKNVNLNYLKNLPQFKFESYFDDKENKQILEIIVENLHESDIISYSYDNENFYTLETKRINYLNFYDSSDVYFKIERNSEVISEAYFDVVYNSYVNSSNNNNLENTNFSLKNLLDIFKNYSENNKTLNLGTNVYNQLKNSKLGLYLTIIITGSFIILFVKSIKR